MQPAGALRAHFTLLPNRAFMSCLDFGIWLDPAGIDIGKAFTHPGDEAGALGQSSRACGDKRTPARLPFWVTTTGPPVLAVGAHGGSIPGE
jgi:hypothetical protein